MQHIFQYLLLSSLFVFMSCQFDNEDNKATADSEHYSENHRPQFHFSPEANWMNDPNGMVFFDGEYHLFYQYYPDDIVWGPMHWGHAVSNDMVSWQHLPVALEPDELGYIFSGSAVVDWNNSSGFGKDGQPPMVAIFTHHLAEGEKAGREDYQYQSIAYSTDKGRTFTKYEGNPVLPNPGLRDFRDPKVVWYEPGNKWVMVLAAGDHIKFYSSTDLKNWTALSEFGHTHGGHGGVWECPDLFPLRVGRQGETKWVLLVSINPGGPHGGSATQYFIGDFDGTSFTNNNSPETQLWLDSGKDNYAGVTWSDIPPEDTRRLFMGWMSNWHYAHHVPTEKWRSAMTLVRSLHLVETTKGIRLTSLPVKELKEYRATTYVLKPHLIPDKYDLLYVVENKTGLYEVNVEFEKPRAGKVEVRWANTLEEYISVGFDADLQQYYIDRRKSGKTNFGEGFAGIHTSLEYFDSPTIKMHIFFDKSSVELFADDGKVVMTDIFFPTEEMSKLNVLTSNPLQFTAGKIYALKSIWR